MAKNEMTKNDLLGNPLSAFEKDVLEVHRRLEELRSREDAPPCARANLGDASVALWNVVNDLMLEFKEPE